MLFWPRCARQLSRDAYLPGHYAVVIQKRHFNQLISRSPQALEHYVRPAKRQTLFKSLKPHREPCIRPNSLQETLEEHRRVNRERYTINGSLRRNGYSRLGTLRQGAAEHEKLRPALKGYRRPKLSHVKQEVKEYGGEDRSLTMEWKASPNLPRRLRFPWVQVLHQDQAVNHNVSARHRLFDEMQAAQAYLSPSAEEDAAAQHVLAKVLSTLTAMPGGNEITYKVIGSRAVGVHNPISDIDLGIQARADVKGADETEVQVLRQVFKYLRYHTPNCSGIGDFVPYMIRKGRVPLVDCEHLSSGLLVQLQCSQDDYDSIEISKAFLAEFRHLGTIHRIMKQMLSMRGLSQGMHGGLSSYPLFHMVAASLKLESHNADPVSQLLGFLNLYSDIDLYTTAIEYRRTSRMETDSTNVMADPGYDPLSLQPMLVPRKVSGPQYLLSLQDPANLDNDLGRAGTLIKHVQATFIEARHRIHMAMKEWDKMYEYGLDMKTHGGPILAYCLEGNYSHFEEQRRRLRTSLRSEGTP